MRRILMTIGSSVNGGAQRLFWELAKGLISRGYEVAAALPPGPLVDRVSTLNLVSRHVLPLDSIRGVSGVARLIGRVRPDVINAYLTKGCMITAMADTPWRIPLCCSLHNAVVHEKLSPIQRRVFPGLYRLLSRFCDGIIVSSENARKELIEAAGIRQAMIKVIPLGIDPAPFQSFVVAAHLRRRRFCIGTIGRLSCEKGQRFLIEALMLLKDVEWECRIVGEGPCAEDLMRLIETLQLGDRVKLPGFRKDLVSALHEFDLFVLPSVNDAFPLVVLEASLARKPVIATNVGGVSALVQDGITGLLVPPRRPDALADRIRYAIEHREEMAAMAIRARNLVMQRFTISTMTDSVISHMKTMMECRRVGVTL